METSFQRYDTLPIIRLFNVHRCLVSYTVVLLWPPSTEEWMRKHIVLLSRWGSVTLWAEPVRWSIRWRGELASLPQPSTDTPGVLRVNPDLTEGSQWNGTWIEISDNWHSTVYNQCEGQVLMHEVSVCLQSALFACKCYVSIKHAFSFAFLLFTLAAPLPHSVPPHRAHASAHLSPVALRPVFSNSCRLQLCPPLYRPILVRYRYTFSYPLVSFCQGRKRSEAAMPCV